MKPPATNRLVWGSACANCYGRVRRSALGLPSLTSHCLGISRRLERPRKLRACSPSTAEVLVFVGVLFNAIELSLAKLGGPIPLIAALTVSSLAFGFFHLTYPEPWNSVATCLMLTGVWAGVSLVFLLSRSLLAAIVFNNVMALIGFMQRDLVLPIGALIGLVAFVAGLGTVAVIVRRSDADV